MERREQDESSDDESNRVDPNDSGVDFSPIKLKGPVGDSSLDWVTELLNWMTDEDELGSGNVQDDEVEFVLVLEKAFSCNLEACLEHINWTTGVRKIKDFKTLSDLENAEVFTSLLDKWINIFRRKHFPSVACMDIVTTIFGRGSRPL